MNTYIKITLMFVSICISFGAGFTWGYGYFKHDQRVNVDDFVKSYIKYQNLKSFYSQYIEQSKKDSQTNLYNLKQYTLQNLYFKHGLRVYKITGEIVKNLESMPLKQLIILSYNPVINIYERLNKIESLIDLYD